MPPREGAGHPVLVCPKPRAAAGAAPTPPGRWGGLPQAGPPVPRVQPQGWAWFCKACFGFPLGVCACSEPGLRVQVCRRLLRHLSMHGLHATHLCFQGSNPATCVTCRKVLPYSVPCHLSGFLRSQRKPWVSFFPLPSLSLTHTVQGLQFWGDPGPPGSPSMHPDDGRSPTSGLSQFCAPPGKQLPKAFWPREGEPWDQGHLTLSPRFPRSLSQDWSDKERWIPGPGQQGHQDPPDESA